MTKHDEQRYAAAAHAMQAGVAMEMNYTPKPTEPKHLRVGVNAAQISVGAIASLLVAKGVFTLDEYQAAAADEMEREAETYRARISEHFGGANITLA